MRIPAVLLLSILVVNALFFPGARTICLARPVAVTREGLTFGLVRPDGSSSCSSPRDVPVHDARRRPPRGARARGASHRIAFVVLSAVQMVPRMQARAGLILEAQQARGLGSTVRSGAVRALVPLVGPVLLGALIDVRSERFALEARGFGARPAGRPTGSWPTRRRTALRIALVSRCVGVVVVASPACSQVTDGDDRRGADGPRRVSATRVAATPALERRRPRGAPGERVGVTGRTGAGKSTLALAAAGSCRAWSGRGRRAASRSTSSTSPRPRRRTCSDGSGSCSRRRPTSCRPRRQPCERSSRSGSRTSASRARRWTSDRRVLDALGIRHLADRDPFALSAASSSASRSRAS